MNRAVYLIGFRGVGKSTIGETLAKEYGWDFFDLDREWERRNGRDIVGFVTEMGISEFRAAETALLRESLQLAGPVIVATGGGIVEREVNRALLIADSGPKIYLEAEPAELWERLRDTPERLKIGGLGDLGAFAALLEERRGYYEKIATHRVVNRDITQTLIELRQILGREIH